LNQSREAREKAAEARALLHAGEERRARNIRIASFVGVGVVVAAIVGVGFFVAQSERTSKTTVDANATLPPGVTTPYFGAPIGEFKEGVPTFELYEDFQCPACKQFELSGAGAVYKAAEDGRINLTLHPMIFMDSNLPQSLDSSLRATSAWGCAIEQGKTREYHTAVFALQQPEGGVGYQDDLLSLAAASAGLSGDALAEFETCRKEKRYEQWARNSQIAAEERGILGTPSALLNDKQLLDSSILFDPAEIEKAIDSAAKAQAQN
jgi:protein-disulfide isomerase